MGKKKKKRHFKMKKIRELVALNRNTKGSSLGGGS